MYSDRERERALMLVELGYSPGRASRILGGKPSRAAIMRWMKGEEPTRRRGQPCALSCAEKVAAVRRVQDGEYYRDVAEDVGCAPSTLLTWRRKMERDGEAALRTRYDEYFEG